MALKVIDVSKYQGKINWSKVKNQIDGAIIQIGYGDDLKNQDDPYAVYNMTECERLGIPYMTYLFSHANSQSHIKSEIAHERRMTKGRKTLGHWLDLEECSLSGFWKAAAEEWIKAFPDGGIYSWEWAFTKNFKGLNCKRWICAYGSNSGKPEKAYKPSISMNGWQYTSKAYFEGISGKVDVSEWYVDFRIDTVKTPIKRAVTKKEVASLIMRHLCAHSAHGYTQDMDKRWGSGDVCTVDIYGQIYTIPGGDRDCSSAVISAYEAAGIDCGGATYTGNMRSCMTKTGNFEWKSMSYTAQEGDCYLNEKNHTAMCLSAVPDVLMEFSINEKGTALGGKTGDQKQAGEYDEAYGRGESHLRAYYNYPWNGILRCKNNEIAFYVTDSKIEVSETTIVKSNEELAVEVILRKHGNNGARKASLGNKYEAVQAIVNSIILDREVLVDAMARYVIKYGPSGEARRELLKEWYDEVQKRINAIYRV